MEEDLRLMDILAQLYVADPKNIKWDDSGSCDTVAFTSSGKEKRKFLLKLSRDNLSKTNGNTLDFRVRVIAM